jgi:hypothetical protein
VRKLAKKVFPLAEAATDGAQEKWELMCLQPRVMLHVAYPLYLRALPLSLSGQKERDSILRGSEESAAKANTFFTRPLTFH